jgi:hypothetical protein
MNAHSALTIAGALLCAVLQSHAGEKVTLIAESQASQLGYSEPLTLEQGESAELIFIGSAVTAPSSPNSRVIVTIKGTTFDLNPSNSTTNRPLSLAGPAVIKLQVGDSSFTEGRTAFATFDVTRTGTASNPTPFPNEAGTVWQVILEASADLVNWTPVAPGDYPSSTPQHYFRTRLVKRP